MPHRLRLVQKQLQGLECSVCGQIVGPKDVYVGSLVRLLARLKVERFEICPSCTQEASPDLQRDGEYQRWRAGRQLRQNINTQGGPK